MINILAILNPLSILLGLITLYLSLSRGLDIYTAVFRSLVAYCVFMIAALIANNAYMLMLHRIKKKTEAEEKENAQEAVKKLAEEKAKKAEETRERIARAAVERDVQRSE